MVRTVLLVVLGGVVLLVVLGVAFVVFGVGLVVIGVALVVVVVTVVVVGGGGSVTGTGFVVANILDYKFLKKKILVFFVVVVVIFVVVVVVVVVSSVFAPSGGSKIYLRMKMFVVFSKNIAEINLLYLINLFQCILL